jgi:hypothetical protein
MTGVGKEREARPGCCRIKILLARVAFMSDFVGGFGIGNYKAK